MHIVVNHTFLSFISSLLALYTYDQSQVCSDTTCHLVFHACNQSKDTFEIFPDLIYCQHLSLFYFLSAYPIFLVSLSHSPELATRQSKRIHRITPSPSPPLSSRTCPHVNAVILTPDDPIPVSLSTILPCIHSQDLPDPSLPSSNKSSFLIFLIPKIMSKSKIVISSYPIMTCLPQLSSGKISPKSAKDYKYHCLTYFVNTKGGIEDNLKVSCILGCFKNGLMND